MSREIKFRVWSEEDKEYRTDCRLTELFTSETGTPATLYSDEGDRFDIEQYTGLKDKNGKEIYEGDIVKLTISNPEDCRVEFDESYARYILRSLKDNFVYAFPGPTYDMEIIGNMHQGVYDD